MKKRSLGIALTALAAAFLASKTGSSSGHVKLDKETIQGDLPRLIQRLGEPGVDATIGDVYILRGIKVGDTVYDALYHPNNSSPGLLLINQKTNNGTILFSDVYADLTLNGLRVNGESAELTRETRRDFLNACSELVLRLREM